MTCSATRYFGLSTMIMLVVLRLTIGWHFFSEGVHHLTDAGWSSEGFLRAAKGPLAPRFQAVLPDYYGVEQQQLDGKVDDIKAWLKRVRDGMADYSKRFTAHYKLAPDTAQLANRVLLRRQQQLSDWEAAHEADIATYVHERERLAKAEADPTAEDVPFQKKRNADKQSELTGQARGWVTEIQKVEREFRGDLRDLLTTEQLGEPALPRTRTQLDKIDTVMTYGILGIGACLLVGLFTRLACVLGAAFLFSVVLTQPFWVSDAAPTFNQWVEMFALLTLATTHVGKWGGLDFFLSAMCCKPREPSTVVKP